MTAGISYQSSCLERSLKKLSSSRITGALEKFRWWSEPCFLAGIGEINRSGDLTGTEHLLRRQDAGRALRSKIADQSQHLLDRLGIKSRSYIVKRGHVGLRRKRAGDWYSLLLAA